ncbi:hypothetical protein OG788_46580 [Streptomyces sp. NBC_00647]|uniref:hypothetical protein n=1 Tax=Streptomyces sp. NBC_00647 TaxID=2975796 RepID=UPI00324A28E9
MTASQEDGECVPGTAISGKACCPPASHRAVLCRAISSRDGALGRPVTVEERGDQAGVSLGELAVAVFGAGFGEPGAEVDGVAVDDDLFPGGGGAASAAEAEFQELDGLLETAALCGGRG